MRIGTTKQDRWIEELIDLCSNSSISLNDGSRLTILTAVKDLGGWLNDSRKYDGKHKQGWNSSKNDFEAAFDALGTNAKSIILSDVFQLRIDLAQLPDDLPRDTANHRQSAVTKCSKLLATIKSFGFLSALWKDLVEGCKDKALETKNRETREIFFAEPLITRLKQLVEDRDKSELVFTPGKGKIVIPQAFERELKIRARMIGITKRVYPHIFRHSFATQLLMSGVEITIVASILGHRNIQTTFADYIHLADKTRRQGMFKHPLIRKSIDPMEVIKGIKETLEGYNLEGDQRFNYSFTEENGGIFFSVRPTSSS